MSENINLRELKDTYDFVYRERSNEYNFFNEIKNLSVDAYATLLVGRGGKILDAGCGEGIHLKRLLGKGFNAFGIELSSVCCQEFLQDTPHENIDILSFAKKNQEKFDSLICMDVLEHIPYDSIGITIASLSTLSTNAFFGIANHSDIYKGKQLHLIQEGVEWWTKELSKYYSNVYFLGEQFEGLFYYFYCENHLQKNKKLFLDFFESITPLFGIENQASTAIKLRGNIKGIEKEKEEINIKLKKVQIENTRLQENLEVSFQGLEDQQVAYLERIAKETSKLFYLLNDKDQRKLQNGVELKSITGKELVYLLLRKLSIRFHLQAFSRATKLNKVFRKILIKNA